MNKVIAKYLLLAVILFSVMFLEETKAALKKDSIDEYVAYVMPYFKNKCEKLHLAYSYDAKKWIALNDNQPVFDAGVRLRDPFVNRVNGKFHLVHTKAWNNPTIYHWESSDLMNWEGGPIEVVDSLKLRAWAPEFIYCEEEKMFYVHWSSLHEGHNAIHYTKTKDWKNISPEKSKVYYDLGIHDIDLTIINAKGQYYAFHKPGATKDKMGNRMYVSPTLDPEKDNFGFGKFDSGKVVFNNQTQPTEGPQVIKVLREEKWYVYCDPFKSSLEAWETTNFIDFKKIDVVTPKDSKHCSIIPVTKKELKKLLKKYKKK